MDRIHHVAITVNDVDKAIEWYQDHFTFEISWRDKSWALLEFENIALALVLPNQHPPHIAFINDNLESFGDPVLHRDGTESVYIQDNQKNVVELLRCSEDK